MFEKLTHSDILQRMLERLDKDIDKREGSLIFDSFSIAALELKNLLEKADNILRQNFADTADREYLIKRAYERGFSPRPAVKARYHMEVKPAELSIAEGERFNADSLNFIVLKNVSPGNYLVECETEGSVGNSGEKSLIPVGYIDGLESAKLTDLVRLGLDEEATEDFRKRFLASFTSQAYGGNIADYKEKVSEFEGVGAVKITPTWQGGGTVKVEVLDIYDYAPFDQKNREKLKEWLDPTSHEGEGYGIAPIGHRVTVAETPKTDLTISVRVQKGLRKEIGDIEAEAKTKLKEYLKSLRKEWGSGQNIIVRLAQIGGLLLDINGVIDIFDLTINGQQRNLVLDNEVPFLANLSLSEGG